MNESTEYISQWLDSLPVESRPVIDDKRRVIIDRLPISGLAVTLNPPKAIHLDNIDTALDEARKRDKPLTNLGILYLMVSQSQDSPMSREAFMNLDTEDVEVIGYALTLFRAYRNLRR